MDAAAIGDDATCPHGHLIDVGSRIPSGLRSPTSRSAPRSRSLRFENEAEDLLHYLKAAGLDPGLDGTPVESGDDIVVETASGERLTLTRSVAETVSVTADPTRRRVRVARPTGLRASSATERRDGPLRAGGLRIARPARS